jgi:hypothetical protein
MATQMCTLTSLSRPHRNVSHDRLFYGDVCICSFDSGVPEPSEMAEVYWRSSGCGHDVRGGE